MFYVHVVLFRYFKTCTHPEYALAGFIPEADLVIPPGPLNEVDAGINAAMSDHLRKLGMIVEIDDGESVCLSACNVFG